MIADAYAILGISPRPEDVVVRAAYRALMQKYTSPHPARRRQTTMSARGRSRRPTIEWPPPAAPARSSGRGRQELVVVEPEAPLSPPLARSPPAFAPASLAGVATPPVANDETGSKPGAAVRLSGAARRLDRSQSGTLALCGIGRGDVLDALAPLRGRGSPSVAAGLKVKLLQRARPATTLAKPLPCFVDGRPAGRSAPERLRGPQWRSEWVDRVLHGSRGSHHAEPRPSRRPLDPENPWRRRLAPGRP